MHSLLRIKALYDEVQRQKRELAELNRTLEQRVADGVRQLERLGRLKRFFSPQLAEAIVAGGAEDPLKSHRREITVVFLDLRGFTAFTETAEPEEVMARAPRIPRGDRPLVLEHEGTLERFAGDGMMIFFNDPVPIADPAPRAVRMALAMQREVGRSPSDWQQARLRARAGRRHRPGLRHARRHRLSRARSTTARSAPSPTSPRACAARRTAARSWCRSACCALLDGQIAVEPAGELVLKGFHRPVPAFRVAVEAAPGAGSRTGP